MKIEARKLIAAAVFLISSTAFAQTEVKQNIKGRVTDAIGNHSFPKAVVTAEGPTKASTETNENGMFYLSVAPGRYKLKVSLEGYTAPELEVLVISGKESVANIFVSPSIRELRAVEVTSSPITEEAPGQRSLTIEKTLRVPANFFDPVRVATAYPGVIAANDQANSIIVRGNSPNGLLWRLNGLDIVNPNHLANAGTLTDKPMANGGGVNILSAQMLDRTDFFMGAFPTQYGNALAGIVDMNLRDGNKDKFEYTAQASLIGLDAAAEGPVGKNKNTSFLANYRYSTVGLLSAMGVNFGDEAISFQDLSFHLNSRLKKGGELSLFGVGGNSKNLYRGKTEDWQEDKEKYDIDYTSLNYAIGLNYAAPVAGGRLSVGVARSMSDQDRQAELVQGATTTGTLSDDFTLVNDLTSFSAKYESDASKSVNMEVGIMTNYIDNTITMREEYAALFPFVIDSRQTGFLIQPYANIKMHMSEILTINAGVRYLNYTYNGTSSIEPRASVHLNPSDDTGFNLSYSLVSQLQLPQVYAAPENSDLGFTKSHHIDFNFVKTLSGGLDLRSGVFYQHLFNVPIIPKNNIGTPNDFQYTYSTLNLLEAKVPGWLANDGTGTNVGVDATVEKKFYNRHYFLVGACYYESKFVAADGLDKDTRFNGNYTANAVYGKEWVKESKRRTIGLNTRVLYLGGLRQSSIPSYKFAPSTIADGVAVDPFSERLSDYFRIDLRVSFRKDKPGYTRTLAIDIQNLTNQQNEAYRYYDLTQGKEVTQYQLGIIPVLVYRIDF